MHEDGDDLVEQLHREAVQRHWQEQGQPLPRTERPTIHYTALPEAAPGPIAAEWNFYRREAGRLLAEGREGKWVLIKGEEIIGIWESEDEARAVARERYLMQPVLIHQILTREPVLRAPTRFWLWRS